MTCEYRLEEIKSFDLRKLSTNTGLMKGCVHMNPNTCITIDVSQGKSHIQGFLGPNKPLGKARSMRHTKQGYQQITSLLEIIKSRTNKLPLVIFEYTGIYHKSLEKFLISHKINYHIVAPLRAAKSRNSEIREQKTDARDCLSLSKLFYLNNLGEFYSENKTYSQLRKLSRFYDTNMKHLVKIKVNFRETLAIIYPNYKKLFDNPYSNDSFVFLSNFPHPNLLLKESEENVINTLCDKWDHLRPWSLNKINEIYSFINNTVSGCDDDDPDVFMILEYMKQIEYYVNQNKDIIIEMIKLAKTTPLYELVYSLPGIKDILTVKFIAELGDISRFKSYKAIIAYAGTDPMIRQSGDKDGLHLKISKKGNSRLRKVLYLMVNSMIKANRPNNAIRVKYQKRTQHSNPLKPKVASIACANQIVRIVFYMHKTSSVYNYQ